MFVRSLKFVYYCWLCFRVYLYMYVAIQHISIGVYMSPFSSLSRTILNSLSPSLFLSLTLPISSSFFLFNRSSFFRRLPQMKYTVHQVIIMLILRHIPSENCETPVSFLSFRFSLRWTKRIFVVNRFLEPNIQ